MSDRLSITPALEAQVLDILHEEEHARCEQLGEGAQVPVRCSCGERWAGAHEFHETWRPMPGDCSACDAADADRVVRMRVTFDFGNGRTSETFGYAPAHAPAWVTDLTARERAGIVDVRVEGSR